MSIQKSFNDMVALAGGQLKAVEKLGKSLSWLHNRLYGKKDQTFSIEDALALQAVSNSARFAEAIAKESGGTFVALPQIGEEDISNEELLIKFQQICEEFGRLGHTHREATQDGVVDAHEKADLQSIADSMHRRIQELLAITFRIYCVDESEGARAMGKVAALAQVGAA